MYTNLPIPSSWRSSALVKKCATKVNAMRLQGNIILLGLFVAVLAVGSYALPSAPSTLQPGATSTFNPGNYQLQQINASAGNITALVISGISQTRAWQGYYGNITGSITLDDANNYTFYNWTSTEPKGQIYATLNSSIAWTSVNCFNFTAVGTDLANESVMETFYNIDTDDVDGVPETYTLTNHPSFQVGFRTMTGCPTSYIFQNDAPQGVNFVNVLLAENLSNNQTGWIYATMIENKTTGSSGDPVCYNNQPCDFQLLVNEDGHGTDILNTLYYFWVELI
jgi:hypothetical protein